MVKFFPILYVLDDINNDKRHNSGRKSEKSLRINENYFEKAEIKNSDDDYEEDEDIPLPQILLNSAEQKE